jgi:hypothetical protein
MLQLYNTDKTLDGKARTTMKTLAFCAAALLFASGHASATTASTASGASALALAGIVADHSPEVSAADRAALNHLFAGNLDFDWPADRPIAVKADAVVCRAGNVDITAWSCELTFGKHRVTAKSRQAHELYATILEAGVPPDGAAGSTFAALTHLDCTINPNVIKQKSGAGASCNFDPGQF